ncbi:MAG: LLM class flavin-dependent oxidoreductase [Gammaproteobacteria bacterium]|nr:LLM class flavin-dependent oxidoreductase [Gammaproteobacteria bacterium]
MQLGNYGIFLFNEATSARELAAGVQKIERLGYGAVWFPEAVGREPFATGSFILSNTSTLIAATGIVNIYGRDAMVSAMGQQTLAEQSGSRFLLGLGVSHSLFVNLRGHDYGKPLATMKSYVEAIAVCHKSLSIGRNLLVEGMSEQPISRAADGTLVSEAGEMPIVLAALGPKMTALSRDISQGSHPYNTTPEHTAEARAILGDGPLLCPAQRVCLTKDASVARAAGRRMLTLYLGLPNYRNNWLRCGFTAGDLEHGGSDRFIDAMVAWGDESTIRARLQAHLDAGASHVPIVPVNAADPALPCWRAVEAFAP